MAIHGLKTQAVPQIVVQQPLGVQAGSVQSVVMPIFRVLSESFGKAFKYNLRTLPIQIILSAMYPLYGVFLTFVAIHVGTLASLTVCFCIYKHIKGEVVTDSSQPPSGIITDLLGYRSAKKLYQRLETKEMPKFMPLTKQQVEQLLKVESSLKTHMVARGRMTAYDSIMTIYEKGIPESITNKATNEELRSQLRYVIYRVNQEKDVKKQQEMLNDLAKGMEDCVPVTQGSISKMFQELACNGAFEVQLDVFIARALERVLDETIYELFPDMQSPNYAWGAFPGKQFPHVKTGFLAVHGKQIGLNIPGASEDINKNEDWAYRNKDRFLKLFHEKVHIKSLIKDFVIMINTDNKTVISNEDFFIWCGANSLGEEAMYNEEIIYPEYFSKPDEDQKSLRKAYINEETAIQVFKKLGYIESC